jgi:hypothetical protein
MNNRYQLRALYIEGWYEIDEQKLLSSTTNAFVFEDPRESGPITRQQLGSYMSRWNSWTRSAGASNLWKLDYEVRQDKDGLLTDWEWWELKDTDICGMAFVVTSDSGVVIEKITYFDRKIYNP